MLSVCSTGDATARRAHEQSDVVRGRLQRKSRTPGPGDPQVRNSSGTNFLIGEGGSFALSELAYSFDEGPDLPSPPSDFKLGGWYHTADFPDLRLDTLGRSLADPTSNGIAAPHRGNYGLYLILDKMLWQPSNAGARGLAGFLRVGGAAAIVTSSTSSWMPG